jgi:hypothetical protein
VRFLARAAINALTYHKGKDAILPVRLTPSFDCATVHRMAPEPRTKKTTGKRILGLIAAIAVGLAVQVIGTILAAVISTGTARSYLETLFVILGFAVMGYLIYKWAILPKDGISATGNRQSGKTHPPEKRQMK